MFETVLKWPFDSNGVGERGAPGSSDQTASVWLRGREREASREDDRTRKRRNPLRTYTSSVASPELGPVAEQGSI